MAKRKKKSRKVQHKPQTQVQSALPKAGHQTDHTPSIIHVDKRALNTFHTLFFRPTHSAQPGEISWNDFLHAMANAGFASEKLQGSAWHFRPSSCNVDRHIQFHEPHPARKIPFRSARWIGRRLTRTFGWNGEMFRLRET